jgi:MAF protein
MKPLLLASTSPYRQQLLQQLQVPFTTDSPNIDESPNPNESAIELVQRLAKEKAQACAKNHPNHWIIGSDQVCVINQQIIGKPHTPEKAYQQLRQASGQAVTFYTGLCLLDSDNLTNQCLCEPFTVHFRDLTDQQIHRYIEKESPLNCAGSFKSEGLGIALFDHFEGRDPNTLIGLPLMALCQLLNNWDCDLLSL